VIDHERADELLAGYVLESLTGDDAAEAERLLTDHVPECAVCRATLDAFQAVSGEIGLSPEPVATPETLLPRLHRSLDGGRSRRLPAWSPARLVAAAAAAIVVVGVAGLALTQRHEGPQQQLMTQADLTMFQNLKHQGATVSDIGNEAKEVVPPTSEELYIFGTDVPAPPPGSTYRIWAVDPDGETWVGDFLPVDGEVALRITVDPTTAHLLITVEPLGSEPSEPGSTWAAAA
jgi:anti-sigma-K factor RskA